MDVFKNILSSFLSDLNNSNKVYFQLNCVNEENKISLLIDTNGNVNILISSPNENPIIQSHLIYWDRIESCKNKEEEFIQINDQNKDIFPDQFEKEENTIYINQKEVFVYHKISKQTKNKIQFKDCMTLRKYGPLECGEYLSSLKIKLKS